MNSLPPFRRCFGTNHPRLSGTFVRLAPNHVSIADPDALQIVYAHGNGSLKSDFYDAFVSIHRGLFNTRDRADHARKRKIVSHIFSLKSVLEFEPYIRLHIGELLKHWDKLAEGGKKGLSGKEGEGGWFGKDGWVWFDCLPCESTPLWLALMGAYSPTCRVQLPRVRCHW